MPNRLLARLVGAIAPLAIALILSAGCGHNVATPSSDNYLRVAMTAEPTTFDPAMVEDGTTIDLINNVYDGLVRFTPDNKLEPDLATSWEISGGGKVYTFHIRPGVKFQSGDPVTASDVVYSWTRALDPALASNVAVTYLGDIEGATAFGLGKSKTPPSVKALDSMTVQVTLTGPKAYWLDTLTYPTAYIINKNAVAKDPAGKITDKNCDGTGPFKVTAYTSGSSVELAANPGYWDGAPTIAGQHRRIVTDASTRHSLYVNGDIDIVDESTGSLQADQSQPALKSQVHLFSRASTFYLALNSLDAAHFPQFKDVRVRQAFAYAIDKKKIVDVVFAGQRTVAEDILPEGIPGYDPGFKGIPYDPAKAQQLLAAAGYPGGKGFPPVPIAYRESYPDVAKTVDLIRTMLQQNLGITVQTEQTEWSTLLSQEHNGTIPAYQVRWAADYLDPQDFYTILFRTGSDENRLGYSNPQLDALCDKADAEQVSATRMSLYHQAAAILANDVPRIPIYYQRDAELIKPYVTGLQDCEVYHLPYTHVVLKR